MSRNHEIAEELAKLASLMAPGGVEDSIGEDDSFQVQDNSGRPIEIHNRNFNTHKLGQEMGLGSVLPAEDWNPPSLAEVQQRVRDIYGDQSHNADFYTDDEAEASINELLQGHSPVVASKRKLNRVANRHSDEVGLILEIAKTLSKFASSVAPGIEDHIGEARNQGASVAERIDSNKSLSSVKAVVRHEPLPEVTSYGGAPFVPSMDTGGFEGAMPVQASANAPVTRRKQAAMAKEARMCDSIEELDSALRAASDPKDNSLRGTFQYRDGNLILDLPSGEKAGIPLARLSLHKASATNKVQKKTQR